MSNRRQFLSTSAALMASAALPRALFAQRRGGPVFSNASVGAYTQGLMTQETFTALIGSSFTAFLENDAIAYLQLMKVTGQDQDSLALTGTPKISSGEHRTLAESPSGVKPTLTKATPAITSFRLTFRITGTTFPQGTYLLDHGTLGRFAIFLVPSAGANNAPMCNAYFSRLAVDPNTGEPTSPATLSVYRQGIETINRQTVQRMFY